MPEQSFCKVEALLITDSYTIITVSKILIQSTNEQPFRWNLFSVPHSE